MRYGKLCSSDYPLVMTILDAVSQGYAVLEIYSLILEMPSQRTCVTSCHFRHNRFSVWSPLKTKNRVWKVQRFLNSPNVIVFTWRKYLCWIAYCNPAYGDGDSCWEPCLDVYNPIDAHLGFSTNMRS